MPGTTFWEAPVKTNPIVPALSLLLGAALFGQAEAPARTDPCDHPASFQEMRDCTRKAFLAADEELNTVYRELMARLDGKQKKRLKAAEKAWLAFRDAQAAFESGFFEGGQGQGQIEGAALTGLTRKRTEELRRILEDAGMRE